MSQCTETDLLSVIDRHPHLCAWGWWNPIHGRQMKINLQADRESLALRFDEFRRAVEWLSRCRATKTATSSSPGSYHLKHCAERATGDYISNGALIAAALYLKIPISTSNDTPNPGIGVSKRCPTYLASLTN